VSTRGMVLFGDGDGGNVYQAYYKHCDSYPTGLGVEIVRILKRPIKNGKEDIINELGLEDEHKRFYGVFGEDAAMAAFNYQGDLEWIYVINLGPRTSLQIFRTSNPAVRGGPRFVFPVWGRYLRYMPGDMLHLWQEMTEAERMAGIALVAIAAYHRAVQTQEE